MKNCILKESVIDMKKDLAKKGESVIKFIKMDSKNRIKEFEKHFGSRSVAEELNLEFEKKLISKYQKKAIRKFMKKGLKGDWESNKSYKSLVDKIENMKPILNPKQSNSFLEELAKERLGFSITREDSAILQKNAVSANKERLKAVNALKNDSIGSDYLAGDKGIMFEELSTELQDKLNSFADKTIEFQTSYDEIQIKHRLNDWYKTRIKGVASVQDIAGLTRSLITALDISALSRQNLGAIVSVLEQKILNFSDETQSKLTKKFCKDLIGLRRTIVKDPSETMRSIYRRGNYINGNYSSTGVKIGIQEEAYPTDLVSRAESFITDNIEKLAPDMKGKFKIAPFAQAQNAYNLMTQMARANLFDMVLYRAKISSNPGSMKELGRFVNSATGRGDLYGTISENSGVARFISGLMFSLRLMATRIETVADAIALPIVRLAQQRKFSYSDRVRLGRGIGVLSITFAIAFAINSLSDDDDEDKNKFIFNLLSSEFGRFKYGNTRFDLSGGVFSLMTMMSQLATMRKVKASGVKTFAEWSDIYSQFFENKAAPNVSLVIDQIKNMNRRDGSAPLVKFGTPINSAEYWIKYVLPISIYDMIYDDKYTDSTEKALSFSASFIGIGTTTYETDNFKGLDKSGKKVIMDLAKDENKELKTDLSSSSNLYKGANENQLEKIKDEYKKEFNKVINSISKNPRIWSNPKIRDNRLTKERKKIRKRLARKYRISL